MLREERSERLGRSKEELMFSAVPLKGLEFFRSRPGRVVGEICTCSARGDSPGPPSAMIFGPEDETDRLGVKKSFFQNKKVTASEARLNVRGQVVEGGGKNTEPS